MRNPTPVSATAGTAESRTRPGWEWFLAAVRLALGALFLYLGLVKAADPVGFLKLIREYGVLPGPPWLNLAAALLPWFEAVCGALLITGVAVRGTAVVSLLMLIPFTGIVWQRALAIQESRGVPFCSIRFDCGCGAGEVQICAKLLENALLILAFAVLLARPGTRWALRPRFFDRRGG